MSTEPKYLGTVTLQGRPYSLFDDGTKLPVVSGGSGEDADDLDDDDDLDKDESDKSQDKGDQDKDPKTVHDPEKKRLSDEAAKRRRMARAFREERDQARAELEQLKGKDKPELDTITAERDTLRKQADKQAETLRSQAVMLALLEAMPKLKVKPEKAKYIARLLDGDDYEIDDDDFEVTGMEDAIKKVLADNPEWVVNGTKDEDDDDDDEDTRSPKPSQSSGKLVTSKKKGKTGYDLATLQNRFPALRK